MFSATSLHFLDMIWQIDSFLLNGRVKLFYSIGASSINSKNIASETFL
jgi:hypothetical protein